MLGCWSAAASDGCWCFCLNMLLGEEAVMALEALLVGGARLAWSLASCMSLCQSLSWRPNKAIFTREGLNDLSQGPMAGEGFVWSHDDNVFWLKIGFDGLPFGPGL